VLPTGEYALFTLVIAVVNLSFALAPLGIENIILRRDLDTGPILLKRTLGVGLLTGVFSALAAAAAYDLSPLMPLLVLAATAGGGAMVVAAAQFQSEQRYGLSLSLTQSPNLVLIVAAVAVTVTGTTKASLPLLIAALGFVLSGIIGWWILLRERASRPHRESWFPWGEALSLAGMNAAGLLLVQLDRLVIPYVLTLHDLATFGVVAAIAGSLFRVLSMGVGYTLVPRLRAAGSVVERRRLIAREAKLVGVIIVAGSLTIWFLTPWIERAFLAGKYHIGGALLMATIFSGVAKIMNSFTKATVTAFATGSEVSLINLLGWVSVGLALAAAIVGARWGLAGLIYGVGLGWLLRAVTQAYLILRHLKLPASIPVTAR
jgi:O-antigen/teichoic acid export membrane protein